MNTLLERKNFSLRLQSALAECGIPLSATKLSQVYNRNSPEKITVGGARKWLTSQTIPTQEKMVILAELTGTHANWLRFGSGRQNRVRKMHNNPKFGDEFLPSEIALVPRQNIPILAEFVALLLAEQRAIERGHSC